MDSGNGFNSNSNFLRSTNLDYGQEWLVNDAKTLQELGENSLKLRYLEKSLKSQRRIQQRNLKSTTVEEKTDKPKYDKNAVLVKQFPFKAEQFNYPNDGKEKPKSLYIKSNDEYGSKKPNDLELAEKYFPIDDNFSKNFNHMMYKNFSLNTAQSRSKVHANLDSVV